MSDFDDLYVEWREEWSQTYGAYLPHIHQDGKMQFITFRLADSLAQEQIAELRGFKERFFKKHPQPWDRTTEQLFGKAIGKKQNFLLDQGYGRCALRNPQVRNILVQSLHFKDGADYNIVAYVIMPNHVHILLVPMADRSVETIFHSIKSFTGLRINQYLKTKGEFWHRDLFDRLIRNQIHYVYTIQYIGNNPRFLRPDEYTLYFAPGI